MPRIVEIPLFTFAELAPEAKEKAREWWRTLEAQDFWPHASIEDAVAVAEILGIEINDRIINMGQARAPDISWSASYCQGDGAMFEGTYKCAPDAPAAIRAYAPNDETLHRIADELFILQARHFGLLYAKCSRISYHYSHSGCMGVQMDREHDHNGILPDEDDFTPELSALWREDERELTRLLREFADWIHRQILAEYEGNMEDKHVDECITINDYEFTAEGERYR